MWSDKPSAASDQPAECYVMRLLLVEDEPQAASVLAKGLREASYAVDVAADGAAALLQLGSADYDAIVLDVMLPVCDGMTVCRSIRSTGGEVPILMVTARDGVEARIEGLDAGADDYLIKPFDFRELLARLRALIRRGRQPQQPSTLVAGCLTIDSRSRRVWASNRELRLTAKEYALLEYFARRAGAVITRGEIAEHVWDEHYDPLSNIVDVYVQRLRRKLEAAGAGSAIRTRRGEGYQLTASDAS
jgi:DNA-binding response OmpR family regulator